jgi:hypothetical protein
VKKSERGKKSWLVAEPFSKAWKTGPDFFQGSEKFSRNFPAAGGASPMLGKTGVLLSNPWKTADVVGCFLLWAGKPRPQRNVPAWVWL